MSFTKEVCDKIEERLLARFKSGALISEVDFLVGAITAIHAMDDNEDMENVPGLWIWHPIANRSIVAQLLRDKQGETERVKRIERQSQIETVLFVNRKKIIRLLTQLSTLQSWPNADYVADILTDMGFYDDYFAETD